MEIFKSLINVLEKLKTPLIFWGFCILLLGLLIYLLFKKSSGVHKIIQSIIDKLSKYNLFKLVKLLIISLFISIVILIILTFCAPIISSYLDKKYDKNVFEILKEQNDESQKILKLNEKYQKIINLYESNKIEEADLLVIDVFNINKDLSNDELKGYIVAAYVGKEDYNKAINLILKRDSLKKKWDYSLLPDMEYCLRGYALKYGFLQAFDYTSQLKKKFNSKLISPFLCLIPTGAFQAIQKGIHSHYCVLTDEEKKNVEYLIDKFPDDLFIDYGLYVLGEYDLCLKLRPNARLKDLLFYAKGYEIIRKFQIDKEYSVDYFDFLRNYKIKQYKKELLKARKCFKSYIEKFSIKPHADDSAYWIAWIEANFNNLKGAFEWLVRVKTLGNGDYNIIAKRYANRLIRIAPSNIVNKYIELSINNDDSLEESYYNNDIFSGIIKMKLSEALAVLDKSADSKKKYYLLKILADNELSKLNIENVEKIIQRIPSVYFKYDYTTGINLQNTIIINEKIKLVRSKKSIKLYENLAIELRQKFHDRFLSIQCINEAIVKFSKFSKIDYLLYLKILDYKYYEPSSLPPIVDELIIKYPNSEYADDALAELVYTNLFILDNEPLALKKMNLLLAKYSNKNACDNAVRALADYYYEKGYYHKTVDYYHALDLYKKIIREYPRTRHSLHAVQRLLIENRKSA